MHAPLRGRLSSSYSCAFGALPSSPPSPFFFFTVPAPTEISTFPYTTLFRSRRALDRRAPRGGRHARPAPDSPGRPLRSEEHTSELQSRGHLVCRLLLEKKKLLTLALRHWCPGHCVHSHLDAVCSCRRVHPSP